MKKGNSRVLAGLAVFGLVVCVLILLGLSTMMRPPVMVPASKEIVYDDFGYTASDAYTTSKLAGVAASEGNAYYVVTAKVSNHAIRVDYEFEPHIVVLYTGDGKRMHRAHKAQIAAAKAGALPALRTINLHPGESGSQTEVFIGPVGLKQVRVGFSTAGWVGDVLDNLFGGNQNILLDVRQGQVHLPPKPLKVTPSIK